MSAAAPVTALMFAGAAILAIGFVAGSFEMFILSIVALFGAGMLAVLDNRRPA
jgi:hypothetical protein